MRWRKEIKVIQLLECSLNSLKKKGLKMQHKGEAEVQLSLLILGGLEPYQQIEILGGMGWRMFRNLRFKLVS